MERISPLSGALASWPEWVVGDGKAESVLADSRKIDMSTSIAQGLIDEAVKAVESHAPPSEPEEPTTAVPRPENAAAAPPAAAPAPAQAPGAVESDEVARLTENLLDARSQLGQREAELALSQEKARETMERLRETHDRFLRAAADLENYKKRAAREKEEVARFGIEALLKDLLPALDNLDRAIEHAQASREFDSLLKGVAITRQEFEATLQRRGVVGFSAKGQAFDPAFHEAIQQVATAAMPPNAVVEELVKGYKLHDRLLRPAVVVVAKRPAPEPEPLAPRGGEPVAEAAAGAAPPEGEAAGGGAEGDGTG